MQRIPDFDRSNDPIVDLHFYKWLESNRHFLISVFLEDAKLYFAENGFKCETKDDVTLLRNVHSHYWYVRLKSATRIGNQP